LSYNSFMLLMQTFLFWWELVKMFQSSHEEDPVINFDLSYLLTIFTFNPEG
jgi:hypothetical protein